MARAASVLGKLSVDTFLKRYWQLEPLVLRNAFPGLRDPLSPDELAGLSCEASVDSRLVMERGGKKPWQVIRGPQKPATLKKLPRSHWTLLVESMDRHSDRIASMASAFSFLPRWRMDDVMVSLAPLHGTVDAHIDSYDVFLVQGQGRRRWEVDRRALPDYRSGLDLRILKRFKPEDSWVLEPGDMLYVPPGVGHRGVTVQSDSDIALTYSVGFRAPSSADLLTSWLARATDPDSPRLFADSGRKKTNEPEKLAASDIEALKRFVLREIAAPERDAWTIAAGEAVTSGGQGQGSLRITTSALTKRLLTGAATSPLPGARLTWSDLERGRAVLFVNGESRVLSRDQAFAAPLLCGKRNPAQARRLALKPDLIELVQDLMRAGVLVLVP